MGIAITGALVGAGAAGAAVGCTTAALVGAAGAVVGAAGAVVGCTAAAVVGAASGSASSVPHATAATSAIEIANTINNSAFMSALHCDRRLLGLSRYSNRQPHRVKT